MIEKTDNPNLAILEIVVEALGDLSDSLVFVGGCAAGLLLGVKRCDVDEQSRG